MSNLYIKYQPRTLDRVIGHEKQVARLKGIVQTGKIPSTLMFTGPTSVGKTTLAMALVADLFNKGREKPIKSIEGHMDCHIINAADNRGIDDLRDLLKMAALQPRMAPRRVFIIDEAQQLTGPSKQLLLKPLERPAPKTMWILCTMEPEKIDRAVRNRTSVFALSTPSRDNILKYVKRVAKGEQMTFLTKQIAAQVVENSMGEMRTAATILEGLAQMAATNGGKVTVDDVEGAIADSDMSDEKLAVRTLVAVYTGKLKAALRCALDISNGFGFATKLLTLNSFLLNTAVLEGEKHSAVWWSQSHRDLISAVGKQDLNKIGAIHQRVVQLKAQIGAFSGVPDIALVQQFVLGLLVK